MNPATWLLLNSNGLSEDPEYKPMSEEEKKEFKNKIEASLFVLIMLASFLWIVNKGFHKKVNLKDNKQYTSFHLLKNMTKNVYTIIKETIQNKKKLIQNKKLTYEDIYQITQKIIKEQKLKSLEGVSLNNIFLYKKFVNEILLKVNNLNIDKNWKKDLIHNINYIFNITSKIYTKSWLSKEDLYKIKKNMQNILEELNKIDKYTNEEYFLESLTEILQILITINLLFLLVAKL